MHGRLKVKTTAEQAEAKKIERQKKLKIFKAANEKINQKRENKEYDKEGLEISGQILSANPDVYTLWNFRREIYEAFKTQTSTDELNKVFEGELYFVETCLRANPKSYGSWNQRCYVMTTMPQPDWNNELALCNKFLEYDERNFHCWDYRRFVVEKAKISPVNELEFSTNKIRSNFSNYSSWHYRSKLLPLVEPDPSQHIGITEEALLNEFDTVQNAFFTDPEDQSAWFYHRWLLGRGERDLNVHSLLLNKDKSTLSVGFTLPIVIGKDYEVIVKLNEDVVEGKWRNVDGRQRHTSVWVYELDASINKLNYTVHLNITPCNTQSASIQCTGHLAEAQDRQWMLTAAQTARLFSKENSAAASLFLSQELDQCEELHELEPDNKWALLTIVLLMRSLDAVKYSDQISESLRKLEVLDGKRKHYYQDLRSKFIMERHLEQLESSKFTLELDNLDLSTIYHTDFLLTTKDLSLSNNKLSSVKNFGALQGVEVINLSNNQLTDLAGLKCLPQLRELNLQNNHLKNVNDLKILLTCPKLKKLYIGGNPLTDTKDFLNSVQSMLPAVETVV